MAAALALPTYAFLEAHSVFAQVMKGSQNRKALDLPFGQIRIGNCMKSSRYSRQHEKLLKYGSNISTVCMYWV
jgi:hypothetical protein